MGADRSFDSLNLLLKFIQKLLGKGGVYVRIRGG